MNWRDWNLNSDNVLDKQGIESERCRKTPGRYPSRSESVLDKAFSALCVMLSAAGVAMLSLAFAGFLLVAALAWLAVVSVALFGLWGILS